MSSAPPVKIGPFVKVRHQISRILPDPLLQLAKKQYYAHRLKRVPENTEPDLIVLRNLVAVGDYTVDVGANVGIYTKFLSRWVGSEGRVYSVEPIPTTTDILRSNVRKLRMSNVCVVNSAVSERVGTATMEVPLWSSGAENFARAEIVENMTQTSLRHVQVRVTTLDSLLATVVKPVSFIKLDVEGHELQCLRGAISTIHNCRPAWLVEVWGDPQDETNVAHTVFQFMKTCGYEPFWFNGNTVIRYRSGHRTLNYWFLMPEHLDRLKEKLQVAP